MADRDDKTDGDDRRVEDEFRESCTDACLIIDTLAPVCDDFFQLTGMLREAQQNDGLLRLLLDSCRRKVQQADQGQPAPAVTYPHPQQRARR